MENPPTTISQVQLVDGSHPGKKLPQYIAGLAATIGALATGTMLGWSSPAGPKLITNNEYGFEITDEDMAWISSLATLGAACICYPIGFIMEILGRKLSMLLMILPFTLGWLLVIFANNLPMMYAGRFIIGIAGGAFCVTAPAYTSEIAQDEIRGALGTFFQLMITIGILFTYVVGSYVSVFILSLVCGVIPLVFGLAFFSMPESPVYLVYKNRHEDAKKALIWLRGEEYDYQSELERIQNKVEEERKTPTSLKQNISQPAARKALIICLSLMFFQQFCGINAVLFNTTIIFSDAEAAVPAEIATIITGVVQVVATLVSTVIIEKLGRRILLMFSACAMVICEAALGVFFFLKFQTVGNQDIVDSISWLPLVSLCIFIVAFSVGFGPIPWLISGELCNPNIKAFVSSSAGTFNWLLAFIVTRTFLDMQLGMGEGGTYWFFAGMTLVGAVFVFLVVPETKGKSVDEIQLLLVGVKPVDSKSIK